MGNLLSELNVSMSFYSSISILLKDFLLLRAKQQKNIIHGWREPGAGSPLAKKKRAEARAQRHHGERRITPIPPPPGSIFVCQCKHFAQGVWRFPAICGFFR